MLFTVLRFGESVLPVAAVEYRRARFPSEIVEHRRNVLPDSVSKFSESEKFGA
jgi:hypothetical protein